MKNQLEKRNGEFIFERRQMRVKLHDIKSSINELKKKLYDLECERDQIISKDLELTEKLKIVQTEIQKNDKSWKNVQEIQNRMYVLFL